MESEKLSISHKWQQRVSLQHFPRARLANFAQSLCYLCVLFCLVLPGLKEGRKDVSQEGRIGLAVPTQDHTASPTTLFLSTEQGRSGKHIFYLILVASKGRTLTPSVTEPSPAPAPRKLVSEAGASCSELPMQHQVVKIPKVKVAVTPGPCSHVRPVSQ